MTETRFNVYYSPSKCPSKANQVVAHHLTHEEVERMISNGEIKFSLHEIQPFEYSKPLEESSY